MEVDFDLWQSRLLRGIATSKPPKEIEIVVEFVEGDLARLARLQIPPLETAEPVPMVARSSNRSVDVSFLSTSALGHLIQYQIN